MERLDSDPWWDPDHIVDFQGTIPRSWGGDMIDVGGPAGTTSNYFETMIAYNNGGFDLARNFANYYISTGATYVFITDSVNGYFFSNVIAYSGEFGGYYNKANNGIVLEGLTDLSDFSHKNVVDFY